MNEGQQSEVVTANKIAELKNLFTLTYKTEYKREKQMKRTEMGLEDG